MVKICCCCCTWWTQCGHLWWSERKRKRFRREKNAADDELEACCSCWWPANWLPMILFINCLLGRFSIYYFFFLLTTTTLCLSVWWWWWSIGRCSDDVGGQIFADTESKTFLPACFSSCSCHSRQSFCLSPQTCKSGNKSLPPALSLSLTHLLQGSSKKKEKNNTAQRQREAG